MRKLIVLIQNGFLIKGSLMSRQKNILMCFIKMKEELSELQKDAEQLRENNEAAIAKLVEDNADINKMITKNNNIIAKLDEFMS